MNLFNKKIAKHSLEPYCVIVTGDRGVGKSTLFALIVEAAKKEGLDVFCQLPYKDCYQIPLTYITKKGYTYLDIDKQWLYSHDFNHCVLLIDEAKPYGLLVAMLIGLCKMNSSLTSSVKMIYTYLLLLKRMMVLT